MINSKMPRAENIRLPILVKTLGCISFSSSNISYFKDIYLIIERVLIKNIYCDF